MAIKPVLLVIALACFWFAAFYPPTRINAVALGLGFWVSTLLF